jgi:hypothetical protein
MNRLQATSRCECQAILTAVLDDARHVLHGAASRGGAREGSPAHSIGADRPNFDIGWLCPFCGRNVMRTFSAGGLRPVTVSEPAAPAEPAKPG